MSATRKKRRIGNLVGPAIQKRRYELDLTQEQLVARCQLHDLDISRATLAQIEVQLRCVTDKELFILARILKVSMDSLFPAEMRKQRETKDAAPRR